MPGLYTITTRASGTILTAVIYNADHQNHVNNADALHSGGYSDNVPLMQAIASPGDIGSEILANSTADELKHIRFILMALKGTTQWYENPSGKAAVSAGPLILQGAWDANTNTPHLTSGVGTTNFAYFVNVPGNTNLDGISTWNLGDLAYFAVGVWHRQTGSPALSLAMRTMTVPTDSPQLFAVDNEVYVTNNTLADLFLILPAIPATNQRILIKDIGLTVTDTARLMFTGTVDGEVNPRAVDVMGQWTELRYVSSLSKWTRIR